MKQFTAIEKLDTGILYALELASSISVLLLAFGLIASMANVLTKGAIYTPLKIDFSVTSLPSQSH
jgi:Zn-dependent membrane protease YugP